MKTEQSELIHLVDLVEPNKDPFISISIKNTAAAIVEEAAQVKKDQKVLIWFDSPGIELVKEMYLRCLAIGAEVKFFMRDYEGDAASLSKLDENGVKHIFDQEA